MTQTQNDPKIGNQTAKEKVAVHHLFDVGQGSCLAKLFVRRMRRTRLQKQKWPPELLRRPFLTSYILHLTSYILHLTSYILLLTSYIIHHSRFAQASVDQLQLWLGESAVLVPAHAFEQGPKRFELAVAVAHVVEQKLLALAQTYRMSAASVRIIGSCQI